MAVDEREEGGASEELECGICCMPYDRCGRAPRRLGGAHGSWKPSRCRHVICSACVCQLAREGWWEEVTCPYCRAVTSLRERGNFLVAGVRRGSAGLTGGGRRRLVLPPIDAELWQRVVRLEKQGAGGSKAEEHLGEKEGDEEEDGGDAEAGQWRLWRALKRLLKGGSGDSDASARSRRGRGRSRSVPPRRRPPINPYGPEIKDLALMTCYII
ncbi:RING finger protein 227 [Zootoca vivipara]|uniref:RING finger protein 227 n=1 Tax=Zootoca vivipara TaxID=8524 RepID=UPI001590ECF0|nr:RING finger protein 227 [Zootoca vivipara]